MMKFCHPERAPQNCHSERAPQDCHPERAPQDCHPEFISGPSAQQDTITDYVPMVHQSNGAIVPSLQFGATLALDPDIRRDDNRRRAGSVLLFSLMIMGVVTLMTQQLIKSVSVGSFFSSTMVHREQAEMLALGGINVAIAQLQKGMRPDTKKQEQLSGAPAQQAEAAKKFAFSTFIREVLPFLERWQTFALTEEYDGIEGEVQICISCEEGKMPLQVVYDEKKGEVTPAFKALTKPFGIKKKLAEGALAVKLGAFFKKRRHRVSEVSALAPIAQDTHLPLWYEPVAAVLPGAKKKTTDRPRDIAFQNLFTTWNTGGKISPLLLSDSLCAVMKLRRPQGGDAHKRKANIEELAKKYVPAISKGNEIVWKTLQSLWETKPKLPKELSDLFSPVVEPRFFSVLSCGKVAGVKQTALAILERVPRDNKPAEKGKETQSPPSTHKKAAASKEARPLFKIRRVYWV